MDRVRYIDTNGDIIYIDIDSIIHAIRKGNHLYCNRDFKDFTPDTIIVSDDIADRIEQALVTKSRILPDVREIK